jgi:hypothetical protein
MIVQQAITALLNGAAVASRNMLLAIQFQVPRHQSAEHTNPDFLCVMLAVLLL